MIIDTLSTEYKKTHNTADATDATFPSRIPTVTEPSGDGVVTMGKDAGLTVNGVNFCIIGTGANNAVLTGLRVIAWNFLRGTQSQLPLWIPTPLAEFAAVMGNVIGVANSSLGTTYFFADTITLVTGNANVSDEIISPANDTIAHVLLDAKGAQKLEFIFDLGASLTAANVLYKKL